MKTIYALPESSPAEQTIIALGNFDGVHRGHQALISRAIERAKETGGQSIIITFEPHPLKLLKPEQSPKLLLTNPRKATKIAELGADMLVFMPFTDALAAMSPDSFVKMLYQNFNPSFIIIGFDYTYGYQGQGNSDTLKAMGDKLGFTVEVLPPQKDGGELISSTGVREALAQGNIKQAYKLLGYWPILEGKVISGEKRGRKLGFPTANINILKEILLPRLGVYAAKAIVDQKPYQAVVNIGSKPTFSQKNLPTVEVHLLDFSRDIYGMKIELHLFKYLRSEKKFNDSLSLIQQIQTDIRLTRKGEEYL